MKQEVVRPLNLEVEICLPRELAEELSKRLQTAFPSPKHLPLPHFRQPHDSGDKVSLHFFVDCGRAEEFRGFVGTFCHEKGVAIGQ